MIKLEHEVFASPEQLIFIIEGMRNPMNSWDKSDSERCEDKDNCDGCTRKEECDNHYISKKELILGPNDVNLMKKLANAGTDHRKLDEWRDFCKWIEEKVPYSWLITGEGKE